MEKHIKSLMLYIIGVSIALSRIISVRGTCRFIPSCSEYAVNTIKNCSIPKSLLLISWRIIRCNPLCKGGFDPYPTK